MEVWGNVGSVSKLFIEVLQRRLLERAAKILLHGQILEDEHLDTLKSRIVFVKEKLEQVDIARDQDLFIDHNIRPFIAPDEWAFEPCPNHYDTVRSPTGPFQKYADNW